MASPFTSRLPSPAACVEILRQGRCTLVATHQVYRILAVNCLILSYMLSVLHLHGVRNGDTQATIAGISMTAFFMGVSWARPMKRLAPVHPHTTVFHPHLIISVLGQFVVHLATLAITVYLCQPYAHADASATAAATATAEREATAAAAAAAATAAAGSVAGEAGSLLDSLFAEPASDGTPGNGGLLGLMLGVRSDGTSLDSPAAAAVAAVGSSVAEAIGSGIAALATATPQPQVAAATLSSLSEFDPVAPAIASQW
jgi:hypothetical protein